MNAPEIIDMEASQLLADLDLDDSRLNNPYEDDQFRLTKRLSGKELDEKNKIRHKMLLSEDKQPPSNSQGASSHGQKQTKKVSSLLMLKQSRYKPGIETS